MAKRAPSDGGLRGIFRKHLRRAQWTTIELATSARGVPDSEYCFNGGRQGWVEFKRTRARSVHIRPEQVAWIFRRYRIGGNAYVAIRRQCDTGPRRAAADELWLVPGRYVQQLNDCGLDLDRIEAWVWEGGESGWDWSAVERCLRGRPVGAVNR